MEALEARFGCVELRAYVRRSGVTEGGPVNLVDPSEESEVEFFSFSHFLALKKRVFCRRAGRTTYALFLTRAILVQRRVPFEADKRVWRRNAEDQRRMVEASGTGSEGASSGLPRSQPTTAGAPYRRPVRTNGGRIRRVAPQMLHLTAQTRMVSRSWRIQARSLYS